MHVASGFCIQANLTDVMLGKCNSTDNNFNLEINSTL